MYKWRTGNSSEGTREQKEERLLCFSLRHREALIAALENAGVSGLEAEAVVEQLRCLTESAARMIADDNEDDEVLAIGLVDWALTVIDKFYELSDELDGLREELEKVFHLEIGHMLSVPRKRGPSALRKVGRRALQTTIGLAEPIFCGADAVFSRAVEQVFAGGNSLDQSLRELCRAVHDCWRAATSRPLPQVNQTYRCKCWEHLTVNVANPLWIILDALGIDIGGRALDCLIAYANGKPVGSVERYY